MEGPSFRDKVILVTGGTAGIGEATVRLFLLRGAHVAFTGRSRELGERQANDWNQRGEANRLLFIEADQSTLEGCQRSVDRTVVEFGRIDVLFNNAGVVIADKSILDTTEEDWEKTMNLNVTGVFRMSKLVVPVMLANASLGEGRGGLGGSIINNASDWGLVGAPDATAYCTSKGAVVLFTKALALELAKKNIRVNAVCPGDTFVKRWTSNYAHKVTLDGENLTEAEVERRLCLSDAIPMGRTGHVDEIASVVLFLASPMSSFMTGVCLPVDGGNTAQ